MDKEMVLFVTRFNLSGRFGKPAPKAAKGWMWETVISLFLNVIINIFARVNGHTVVRDNCQKFNLIDAINFSRVSGSILPVLANNFTARPLYFP